MSRFPPRSFSSTRATATAPAGRACSSDAALTCAHTVLAECVEGKGRFLDDIADGIWAICEETFWGVPAHMGAQKRGVGLPDVQEPIIELFSAETGALLAWTHYLFGRQIDKVHPLIRERLESEIERRLLSVYRSRQDFGWMGLNNDRPVNNWNPWIHSNLLTCALLMDADPARRAQTVYKILTSLDRFLDSYHDDGGCDEGPGYWNRAGASLFECLDLLHSASNGSVNYFDLPLVRQIGAYIYKVHIAGDWYVNFADAPAKVKPDGSLLYRYGKATGDRDLQAFGAYQYQHSGAGLESLGRALPALFQGAEIRKAEARDPLVREAWLDGIQVATARRRAGTTEGFYFAALGGHNAESHNHNDVGNFVVYLNGNPVLIDVGVENYTAKTFSSKRYEIWTMQSAFHNLPTINGVMQAAGRQYEARDVGFHADDAGAEFSADLAAAYPKEAAVEKWRRSVRLDRAANAILVTDRFALRGASGKIEMSLMTPCSGAAGRRARGDPFRRHAGQGERADCGGCCRGAGIPDGGDRHQRQPAARVMGQSPVSYGGGVAEPACRGRAEIRDYAALRTADPAVLRRDRTRCGRTSGAEDCRGPCGSRGASCPCPSR